MESRNNYPQGRNLQLDFFRGVALMIIFVNHMPLNELFYYTPSRFGFSDAAEIFVFLSGFASAVAYGRCFQRVGLWIGTLRILHRCWQIYVSHLALFVLLAVICVLGNQWMSETDYIHRLYIDYFFDHTREALLGLISLRYVPNFFDILPMYLVIMIWVPVVWALSRLNLVLAMAFPVLVYWAMWRFGWELPADPASDRPWFFNPFAWQLMFFTGFAFGSGWLRVPGPNRLLVHLCLLVVILSIPLAHSPTYTRIALLSEWRAWLEPLADKSHLGLLRWAHFLALAYLMNRLFSRNAHWLEMALPRWIARMGQQSLPVFLFSMGLSYVGGMVLDWTGRDMASIVWVNFAGLGIMLLMAKGLAWWALKPWKPAAEARAGHVLPETGVALQRAWPRRAVAFSVPVAAAFLPALWLQGEKVSADVALSASASPSQQLEGSLAQGPCPLSPQRAFTAAEAGGE